ncbi:MAG: hypothetical protein JSV07_01690 [Acidimicrobiia bacterium]|nr:MAG: hypothetical protein JSV07_01690 [Acidimicrobiia bacterium]
MSGLAPGSTGRETHPPAIHTPLPGAVARPTVRVRPWITPKQVTATGPGFAPHSPYVRRFWTAVAGPSAVADLLRLIAAAGTATSIPLPRRTPLLLTAGLIARDHADALLVPDWIPVLPEHLVRRLPPRLKRVHPLWARAASLREAAT